MWKYESSLRAAQASAIAVMVSSRDGTVAEGKIPSKSGCFLCRAPLCLRQVALSARCILHPVPFIYPQLHLESSSSSFGCPNWLLPMVSLAPGCQESGVTALGCGMTKNPTLSVPSPSNPEHFQHKPLPLPFLLTIAPYFLSFYLPSLLSLTFDFPLTTDLSLPSALFLRSLCFAPILVNLHLF